MNDIERSSNALARRALLITSALALVGASLGIIGVVAGSVVGLERPLVLSCVVFSAVNLILLLGFRRIPLQTIATLSTIFFAVYLYAGSVLSLFGAGEHLNFFVYLVWFFPLLAFNKLVNAPKVGEMLGTALQVAPVAIILGLAWRTTEIFQMSLLLVLVAFALSYTGYGLMLNAVTRYREAYIVDRERGEALKIESKVLESISDCFLSLDSEFRLVYLNDAACGELGVERLTALHKLIQREVPKFFSEPMREGLVAAAASPSVTMFEAQNEGLDKWYVVRCYPRLDGVSVYFRNITETVHSRRRLEDAQTRIEHLAYFDALTNLPNRVMLRERLVKALATASANGRLGALLLIDVDDFKTLNDTQGHEVGDLFLKQAAQRILSCAWPADTVGRLGGDEFVLVLEQLSENAATALKDTRVAADMILGVFEQPFKLGSYEFDCSVSVGVTLFRAPVDTVDELLKRAELAMYRAKSQARNSVSIFDPAMAIQIAARAALQADLRRALPNGEFELHYQPQVSRNGHVIGAEALLRWRHPVRGMVPPIEFIPLAEKDGLIIAVGRWVLQTACKQLALWEGHQGLEELTIAVNVSMLQFMDTNFVELVEGVVLESGANPRRLKLEITESSIMEKVEDTIEKMNALRLIGVGFSLDDFGTGYSSLSHLKRLSLDQLKIDRSFVMDVLTDEKNVSIICTIITLGKSLNLTVIAEGVETEAQRVFLEGQGCDVYQGYLFSPAVTAVRFEEFVAAAALDANPVV